MYCNRVVIHCKAVGFVGLEPNPALSRPSGTMSSLLFYSLPSLPQTRSLYLTLYSVSDLRCFVEQRI